MRLNRSNKLFCAALIISGISQALQIATAQSLTINKPTLALQPPQLSAQQNQIVAGFTSAQMQQYQAAIQPTLTKLKNDIATHKSTASVPSWQSLIQGTATPSLGSSISSVYSSTYNFVNSQGTSFSISPSTGQTTGQPLKMSCGICGGNPPIHGTLPSDNDQDGLPDSLESQVADNFTPYYGSSSGEHNQFATFGNYVPMNVTSLVGTVPPYSYFRVQPLGLTSLSNGTQVFALRIDYLTLWNADDGLVGGGGSCFYSYVGLDSVIQQVSGHPLDAERSAMLVAAPAVNGGYNPDPSAYSLYTVYTAAHEGTFFDQSTWVSFSPAVPAGNHLELALSLSKHSTYTFNPDYYPITPEWFIEDYNLTTQPEL